MTSSTSASAPVGEIPNCAICQEPMEPSSAIFKLNCNHKYHKDCLQPWLNSDNKDHDTCPLDRKKITSINGEPVVLPSIQANNNEVGHHGLEEAVFWPAQIDLLVAAQLARLHELQRTTQVSQAALAAMINRSEIPPPDLSSYQFTVLKSNELNPASQSAQRIQQAACSVLGLSSKPPR